MLPGRLAYIIFPASALYVEWFVKHEEIGHHTLEGDATPVTDRGQST